MSFSEERGIIVLDPDITPKGLGFGVDQDGIWVITKCCRKHLSWEYGVGSLLDWSCVGCGTVMRGSSPMGSHSAVFWESSTRDLTATWIAEWSGFAVTDIGIEVRK